MYWIFMRVQNPSSLINNILQLIGFAWFIQEFIPAKELVKVYFRRKLIVIDSEEIVEFAWQIYTVI